MKNWNSKDSKYTNIKSTSVKDRATEVNKLHDKGVSVKDIADRYDLSESRIREYLKK
jgi:DNA-binding NarL/FixJ family response regulator